MKTNMKTISSVLVMALLMAAPGLGQNTPTAFLINTGALTAASSSCLATNCVAMPVVTTAGAVGIQIAGTFSATVQFEGTVDGTNYVAVPGVPITGGTSVTSATAAGIWQVNAVNLRGVRARVSTFASGTVNVAVDRSPAAVLQNVISLAAALSVTSLTSTGAVSGTTGTFTGAVVGTSVRGAQSALTSSSNATTFDAAVANSFTVTLGENSTLTVSNPVAGREFSALVCQDGTGSRTWAWGTQVKGGTTITSTASKCTSQHFVCDGTSCWATAAAATNM